ncbi:MAG: alpha-ribazole phosphatase family protein [Methylococcales bacterium]|nr:alpha-ribazole phosphatase family protein [Methylococcales bacterium]
MITTQIDLLRHGEVQGGQYYRGITDDALTEKGWQQMQKRVQPIKDWELIISSPLQRCLNFAKKLNQQRNIPLIIDAGFQEINFGDWERKTATEIEQQWPQYLMKFYQDPIQYPPPKGESIALFQQRILKSWQAILQHYQGQNIVIITHAGVIRALFSLLLNIPTKNSFSVAINHASLSRFQCFHGEPNFTQLNFHLT